MMLRIPVLAGAAVGLCSAIYFLCLASIGPNLIVTAVVELAGIAAMVRWFRWKKPSDGAKPTRWLVAVYAAAAAAAAGSFALLSAKMPQGDTHAFAIWNLHARFLERGAAHWSALFSPFLPWTHADLPLLLPAFIAQIWAYLHSETMLVPILTAALFTFGTASVVTGAVRRLRGWDQALIAGTLLLSSAAFVQQGRVQYADVPLGFYMAAALAMLSAGEPAAAVLAGVMAGCAAWTKNEGALFVISLVVVRAAVLLRLGQRARMVPELGRLLAGAAPLLAVLVFFKLKYAPANDLIAARGQIGQHLLDLSRYITVVQALVTHLFTLGGLIVPAAIVIVVYWYLVRAKVAPANRAAVWTAGLTVAIMLLGETAVLLLLPNDVNSEIQASLDRLLVQLWPSFLLLLFWSTAAPQFAPEPAERAAAQRVSAAKQAPRKSAATRHR